MCFISAKQDSEFRKRHKISKILAVIFVIVETLMTFSILKSAAAAQQNEAEKDFYLHSGSSFVTS